MKYIVKVRQEILAELGRGTGREGSGGAPTCICPGCGYTTPHLRGIPCNKIVCPKCGQLLTGEGAVGELSVTSANKIKPGDYVTLGKAIVSEKKHKISKGTVLEVLKVGKKITLQNLDGEKIIIDKNFPLKVER